jgi:hypothetical protein
MNQFERKGVLTIDDAAASDFQLPRLLGATGRNLNFALSVHERLSMAGLLIIVRASTCHSLCGESLV